ncbi:glycoside hydrolase family 2 TIM barrel-domain containing protein [Glaciecola petra]|uniref:Glycoside hydrolase family 2 TIM barrel-domain containing protein n=1 Tax=Glaciecola petra TaxID=3075602 RepID=A0ABU2ZRR2_9ALTE|nr:glycoside hydrolase family 2 TIM barrel-domain containing protein [Aestuariibacter sp. P117]MDT0595315.1 glycoside hydrolase family 2 TIM barrel-domain containing protein [Aestuariibacter sp. P117]
MLRHFHSYGQMSFNLRSFLALILSTLTCINIALAEAIKVEIVEKDEGFVLMRGGEPYLVKGVGLVDDKLQRVVDFGANSIRTWSVDDNAMPAKQLLDKAHALGLTVSLCLEFAKERQGFDYNDPVAVAKQLEASRQRVMKYKDHPALLTWIIGNEVNFAYENPKVFDAVNDVAKMIKELDPNHPTTTALAGFDKKALKDIKERAPVLDFISFQIYADLMNLPKYIKESGFDQPYFVTEWGAVGHWEVYKTPWGAPVENTSSEKANNYYRSYSEVLAPYAKQAIGNYVFLWGQKQEKTPTWYGMFLHSGEITEPVDIMHHIWKGEWPENQSPKVSPITLDEKTAFDDVMVKPGQKLAAKLYVDDPDNDSYEVMWEIRKETTSDAVGGDEEYLPSLLSGLVYDAKGSQATIKAPQESGPYRLFAYIYDGNGNAAHANFPFFVDSQLN